MLSLLPPGFVHDIDAMQCAVVSSRLGAGRDTVGAPINYAVGLELCTAVGNKIDRGNSFDDNQCESMYIKHI